MQYYALIDNLYYRLFKIEENYGAKNPNNNFIKWSTSIEPKQGKILKTDEHTIHPDKIHLKTNYPINAKLVGDYKSKHLVGKGVPINEYETLYEFGYDTLKEGLIGLRSQSDQNGFAGRKVYSSIKEREKSVDFPDDPFRPYWMGAYFTTYDSEKIKHIFRHEDIDKTLSYKGERGNVVTLLKFITPEWETLKLPPRDRIQGWTHPSGNLLARYHIQILG